jgi:hypothetical protein
MQNYISQRQNEYIGDGYEDPGNTNVTYEDAQRIFIT